MGCRDGIFTLKSFLHARRQHGLPTHIAFIDLVKAYDTANHESPKEIRSSTKIDRCGSTSLHGFEGRLEDWEAQDGNPSRSRRETRRQHGRSTFLVSNDCFRRSNGKEIRSSRDFKT